MTCTTRPPADSPPTEDRIDGARRVGVTEGNPRVNGVRSSGLRARELRVVDGQLQEWEREGTNECRVGFCGCVSKPNEWVDL